MEKPVKETLTIEFKSDRKCYATEKLYEDLVGYLAGWRMIESLLV